MILTAAIFRLPVLATPT